MARSGIGNFRKDFRIPLHASTQCAIRTPQQAVFLESLGFSRLILERELSLEQIRAIRNAVTCELEFFVHGALCVCYSGQCYLSEHIAGRSANRGACIQACRSRYDLVDDTGKVLVKDKALLSLKDFNLHDRIEELAEAGITSFKIEGRLKNISYVRNIVRYYSQKIDSLIEASVDKYERGSFGRIRGGFVPAPEITFNRGYTELFIDGKKGKWACMDAAKSMGELIGTVSALNRDKSGITIRPARQGLTLNNGDGMCFIDRKGNVAGFRADVCKGCSITSKSIPELYVGAEIYRNINAAFEKELDRKACIREIDVHTSLKVTGSDNMWKLEATSVTEDGREAVKVYEFEADQANNRGRMEEMIRGQLGKTSGHYSFRLTEIHAGESLPFMSASFLNTIRRDSAETLDGMPCKCKDILTRDIQQAGQIDPTVKDVTYKHNVSNHISTEVYTRAGGESIEKAFELIPRPDAELMRTKYCIRYELGICPVHHNVRSVRPLFLVNNGRRLALNFDCRNCEMTVTATVTEIRQN
jgi:putative protease